MAKKKNLWFVEDSSVCDICLSAPEPYLVVPVRNRQLMEPLMPTDTIRTILTTTNHTQPL